MKIMAPTTTTAASTMIKTKPNVTFSSRFQVGAFGESCCWSLPASLSLSGLIIIIRHQYAQLAVPFKVGE
jgi:hypothetical protein